MDLMKIGCDDVKWTGSNGGLAWTRW